MFGVSLSNAAGNKFNEFTRTVYILVATHGKVQHCTVVFIVFGFWFVVTSHRTQIPEILIPFSTLCNLQ